jgi:hypothetical protein
MSGPKPLIPLLPADDAAADPVVLATWHEAISGALAADVPHDLFALWLYPPRGEPVLLGPAELAQHELAVPEPAPVVGQEQLRLMEDIVRDAGYGSAACLPIRFGRRDVGLLLAADLRAERYGAEEQAVLQEAVRQLAPGFARIARRWQGAAGGSPLEQASALIQQLGRAAAQARTPKAYARTVSAALDPLLPHERLELFVPGASAEQTYRFGEHEEGPLWSDPTLTLDSAELDVAALMPDDQPLLVADTRSDPRWPREAAAVLGTEELRSMLGVRLVLAGRTVGFLLLGSVGADFYRAADGALLSQIGPLIATRVDAFAQGWLLDTLRSQLGSMQAVPQQLRRMAALLATAGATPEGVREFVAEATALLPFHRVRFALRLGDPDRAAIFVPGETRALADLPQVPMAGSAIGRVLSGELPNAVVGGAPDIELIFPLRVAGQRIGALVLTTEAPDAFSRAHLALAQQVADLLAPYLELQRRAALAAPSMAPGWKRTPKL